MRMKDWFHFLKKENQNGNINKNEKFRLKAEGRRMKKNTNHEPRVTNYKYKEVNHELWKRA